MGGKRHIKLVGSWQLAVGSWQLAVILKLLLLLKQFFSFN
jgi:hypothetical protein